MNVILPFISVKILSYQLSKSNIVLNRFMRIICQFICIFLTFFRRFAPRAGHQKTLNLEGYANPRGNAMLQKNKSGGRLSGLPAAAFIIIAREHSTVR